MTTQPYLSRQVTLTVQKLGLFTSCARVVDPAPLGHCRHGMRLPHPRRPHGWRFPAAGAVALLRLRGAAGSASQGETTAMSALTELADPKPSSLSPAPPEVDAPGRPVASSLGGARSARGRPPPAADHRPGPVVPGPTARENLRAAFPHSMAVPGGVDCGHCLGAYCRRLNLRSGPNWPIYRRPRPHRPRGPDRAVPIEVSRAASDTPDAEPSPSPAPLTASATPGAEAAPHLLGTGSPRSD